MSGCTVFTPYNVELIPDVDIRQLQRILDVKEDVAEYKAMMNARK